MLLSESHTFWCCVFTIFNLEILFNLLCFLFWFMSYLEMQCLIFIHSGNSLLIILNVILLCEEHTDYEFNHFAFTETCLTAQLTCILVHVHIQLKKCAFCAGWLYYSINVNQAKPADCFARAFASLVTLCVIIISVSELWATEPPVQTLGLCIYLFNSIRCCLTRFLLLRKVHTCL